MMPSKEKLNPINFINSICHKTFTIFHRFSKNDDQFTIIII